MANAKEKPSLESARVTHSEPLKLDESRWITLRKLTYTSPDGSPRHWESAERLTRPSTSSVDAVGITCILDKPSGPEILLQKQYRPPIDKVCIEVPAGLFDEGESIEACALRELKEETGFVGRIACDMPGKGISPVIFNDPGFCNTNTYMVHVSVDMTLPANQNPQPQLEAGEFIECFSVPLVSLFEECQKLEKLGYAIDARVGTIADGIELARRWGLAKTTVKPIS